MRFRKPEFFSYILLMVLTIVALNIVSRAQSVTISHTGSATPNAPATFTVYAEPSTSAQKVVFYRNDVPFLTDLYPDSQSRYELPQASVGQETYTYRARAYLSSTSWVESASITVTVKTPLVFRMGDAVPTPSPNPSPSPTPTPKGPDRYYDHTAYVRQALQYISANGGGTLFFPCSGGTYPDNSPDLQSIYNISDTIVIPSNVTLQGESAESPEGRCRIYWRDPTWFPDLIVVPPAPDHCYDNDDPEANPNSADLLHKPMFQINGGTSGVRFRDLFLYSRSSGPDCHVRQDFKRIESEETAGIVFYGFTGDITDIIVENVSIINFTWGIKATTCNESTNPCTETENKISDVRLRAYRPAGNHRQLSINAKYAYEWDVQNFNINAMMESQGGVEIIRSGSPSSYAGENKKLKFLQLNCNGNFDRSAAFCVDVYRHGGLYFKQLHHEGVNRALHVNDIDPATNPEPIVMDGGVATGKFYDDSMKLYLVGNWITSAPQSSSPNVDNGTLEFFGDGVQSTIVDCGDLHGDRTDTLVDNNPNDPPDWEDWRMSYTHSERNRSSFFAPMTDFTLDVPHKPCPQGVSGYPNTSEIGGEHFDTGVLPVEPAVYIAAQIFDSTKCNALGASGDCAEELQDYLDNSRRTLVIKGVIPVKQKVTIPTGRQIVGIPDGSTLPEIDFTPSAAISLFEIRAPTASEGMRTSGLTIRNLKMDQTNTQTGTTGIEILGGFHTVTPGVLSDVHFSGLAFEDFETGFYAGRRTGYADPMLDGVSLRNFSFVNNKTSVRINGSNISNWNVMDIAMQSNSANAEGWDQKYGGNSIQNISCQGTSNADMKDCVRLEMGASYISNLKKTQYVTNVVTIKEGSMVNFGDLPYQSFQTSWLNIRNSDLRTENSSRSSLNLLGKAFIVSLNNKYDYFTKGTDFYEGELSSVTSCNDTGGTFSVLEPVYYNNYVGLNTPTLITCGANPYSWENPIKWGEDGDIAKVGELSLVGNFYDDVKEDHVVFRPGSAARFLIRQAQGIGTMNIQWGTTGDVPVVGRFLSSTQRSQIAVYRPSTGVWWIYNPATNTYSTTTFGLSGDVPIVGNFFSEGSNPADQRDEIAIYRPSTKRFWILNPRTLYSENWSRGTTDYGTNFQVGDFLNLGYEQVAQFQNGNWYITDLDTGTAEPVINFGTTGDTPVAGKYFDQGCTQLGVWNPGSQEFRVQDAKSSCSSSGARDGELVWNKNYGSSDPNDYDLPLVMNDENGLARPTALVRIAADPVFEYFIMKHRWWVHDPITPNP